MKSDQKNRRVRFESMEKRELLAADLGMDLATGGTATAGTAEIDFVEVGGGDLEMQATSRHNTRYSPSNGRGRDLFATHSRSFGVEREMKESGEKGGTADINIGIGELQEGNAAAATDAAIDGWGTPRDAEDRPTEEVALYFNKIPS